MKAVVATRNTVGLPDFAGNVWVPLQYVAGLQALGVEVWWVDRQSRLDPRATAPDRSPQPASDAHSVDYAVARFEAVAQSYGFAGRWCVVYDDGVRHLGLSRSDLEDLGSEADLLLNIAGYLEPNSPLRRIPRRAYIDVDPGFTQMWGARWDIGLAAHTCFFTVGQAIGAKGNSIPTLDVEWRTILPPVALDLWPPRIDEACERFSTIADWRGSQHVLFEGEYYTGKRAEFIRFLGVPHRAAIPMEVALCIGPDDYEDIGVLVHQGWCIRDPYLYAGDLDSYREFIQSSRAEFSVAKSGYVRTRSGWVSDRTACYLASGKPAVVQSTGFEDHLPTGAGLLTFTTLDEAVAAVGEVQDDYLLHCGAARRLAEERFDATAVLGAVTERALA